MNLYHCMIDLKSDAKALAFASAAETWLTALADLGLIGKWRLLRRKLGLASAAQGDFLLEIEVESLEQLESTFHALCHVDDLAQRHYEQFHHMIASAEVGLYRPFPDPERRERIALI
ncbi:DUF6614 family protein [Phaeovulum sp.]|uniref:DUF6614 family protein n=1 Tax=Phaeovulum sp. TaxID=2934796 RepID=UPI0035625A33